MLIRLIFVETLLILNKILLV